MNAKLLLLSPLLGAFGAIAQQPADQVQAAAQLQKPKTQLEQFQAKTGSALVKGYKTIGSLPGKFGSSITVTAMEFTDAASGAKQFGITIEVKETSRYERKNTSYVDLDEIDSLLSGMDYISRVTKSSTKLVDFEAIYRTKGDLSIDRFTRGDSTMVAVQSGTYGGANAFFDSKELPNIRALLDKAQTSLEAVK